MTSETSGRAISSGSSMLTFTEFARARGYIGESDTLPVHEIVQGEVTLFKEQHDFSSPSAQKWKDVIELLHPTPAVMHVSGKLEAIPIERLRELKELPHIGWAEYAIRSRAVLHLFSKDEKNPPSHEQLDARVNSDAELAQEILVVDRIIRNAWSSWFNPVLRVRRSQDYYAVLEKWNKRLRDIEEKMQRSKDAYKRLVQELHAEEAAWRSKLLLLDPNHRKNKKDKQGDLMTKASTR